MTIRDLIQELLVYNLDNEVFINDPSEDGTVKELMALAKQRVHNETLRIVIRPCKETANSKIAVIIHTQFKSPAK